MDMDIDVSRPPLDLDPAVALLRRVLDGARQASAALDLAHRSETTPPSVTEWADAVRAQRAPDDPDALTVLTDAERLVQLAEQAMADLAAAARLDGASWTQIGGAIGMTRQAAWKRYRRGPGVIVTQTGRHGITKATAS